MAMEGKIANRDGKLFVVYAYTLETEPTRRTMWWRVKEARGHWAESPKAGDTATSAGRGTWNTYDSATRRGTGSVSTGDGSAQAEYDEESPVVPPSAGGKELRWNSGEWQKLLRTGWVSAGEGGGKKKPKGKAKLDSEIAESLAKRGG